MLELAEGHILRDSPALAEIRGHVLYFYLLKNVNKKFTTMGFRIYLASYLFDINCPFAGQDISNEAYEKTWQKQMV